MASGQSGDLPTVYADGKLFNAVDKGGTYLKLGYDGSATQNSGLRQIEFNANGTNAVYGSSSTVQPPTITLVPQLRY